MLSLLLAFAMPAHADQCAWITPSQAKAAVERLKSGSSWLSYCEPCGDEAPTPGTVGQATAAPVSGGDYHEVSVDGQPIDLAYAFVKAKAQDGFYTNLAKLADCPASGVSRRLEWPPSGSTPDRLSPWLGTYSTDLSRVRIRQFFSDPNVLEIQLEHPTEHSSGAATIELMSTADIDADPVAFATPFGDCQVVMARTDTGVALKPTKACGTALNGIAGAYRKIE